MLRPCAVRHRADLIYNRAPVAQRIEQLTSNQQVVGSIPTGGARWRLSLSYRASAITNTTQWKHLASLSHDKVDHLSHRHSRSLTTWVKARIWPTELSEVAPRRKRARSTNTDGKLKTHLWATSPPNTLVSTTTTTPESVPIRNTVV